MRTKVSERRRSMARQQHDTDRNSEDRRTSDTRNPRMAHPEAGDQADESADEKEPAKQDLDRERSDARNNDGGQTEDDKNDPSTRKKPNAHAAMSPPRPAFARCRACSSAW